MDGFDDGGELQGHVACGARENLVGGSRHALFDEALFGARLIGAETDRFGARACVFESKFPEQARDARGAEVIPREPVTDIKDKSVPRRILVQIPR